MTRRYKQKGFTLIELAIALMVIGLLIGGVLKGQELIENARITSFIRDLNAYDTATMIFRNTYGGIPGDYRHASTRIPNCTDNTCRFTTAPATLGNSQIDNLAESQYFWPQLVNAGMVKLYDYTPVANGVLKINTVFPAYFMYISPYNDSTIPAMFRRLSHNHVLHKDGAADDAFIRTLQRLDDKMDDGKANSGSIASFYISQCRGPNNEWAKETVDGCAAMILIPSLP